LAFELELDSGSPIALATDLAADFAFSLSPDFAFALASGFLSGKAIGFASDLAFGFVSDLVFGLATFLDSEPEFGWYSAAGLVAGPVR